MGSQKDSFLTSCDFRRMITVAGRFIERNREVLNRLNIFPVPDGDTGTNMNLTIAAATAACGAYRGGSVGELAARVASQALMGAQGNSGVIFSQLLRGLARGLRNQVAAGPACLSRAWRCGAAYAYKAVACPVEGTMLTVARWAADGARRAMLKGAGIEGVLEGALREARNALEQTREVLPALREAGVVDAGGAGLVIFLQGCLFALQSSSQEGPAEMEAGASDLLLECASAPAEAADLHLEYPYCTELFVDWPAGKSAVEELKVSLSKQGDSLLVVNQGGLVKVHLHTADPQGVINACASFGPVSKVKVTHMPGEPSSLAGTPAPDGIVGALSPDPAAHQKDYGVIAVAGGDGIKSLFLSLGADEIVTGGPSMNTPVGDLLAAVNRLPYPGVLILANNRNILPAARQVQEISGKEVAVPSICSIPQGLAALLALKRTATLQENAGAMETAAGKIGSGEIAAAVRHTVVDGVTVKKGDFLGLADGQAVCAGRVLAGVALELVGRMQKADHEILTLIYGQQVSPEAAAATALKLAEAYPHLEVEVKDGGQPVYSYYIYLE